MSDDPDTQPEAKRQRGGRRAPRDGEIGIRYGNRNYLKSPGQMLVDQWGDWHLVHCPSYDRDGWMNFKLYSSRAGAKKNMWQLSYRAGRFTNSSGMNLLREHHPEVLPWVVQTVGLFEAGGVEHKPERGKVIVYRAKSGWKLYRGRK